jgi:phosphopantetheinyl transferase (holo-ACP synthase)
MGISIIKDVGDNARIGLWHIQEDLDTLLHGLELDDEEIKVYETFGSDLRKKQWLAYRKLIGEMTGTSKLKVRYNADGKPYIPGSNIGLSVSHTGDYAAAILAEDAETGIDIEFPRSRILKIRSKYLHPDEDSDISHGDVEELTTYWCAKEALYKLNGRKFLDFKKELRISRRFSDNTRLEGKLILGEGEETFDIFAERMNDLICVYVIKAKG